MAHGHSSANPAQVIRSMEEALTQQHLQYLLEDTFDVHTKWRFIGLRLGFTQPMLSSIRSHYSSSEEQYTEMLSRWISGSNATMTKLIAALEANTVQMNAIAKRLREKYATPQKESGETEERGDEKREYTQPAAGRDDHRSESIQPATSSVGNSEGPSDIETPAVVLTQANLHKIRSNFSILVSKASDQLEEKKADLSKFRRYIITSFSITHERCIAEFKAAGDVASLFDLLTKHGLLSYKNYHFLATIINEFISDLHADMVDYQKDYAGYQYATNLERHLAAETNLVDPNPELFSCLKITIPIKLSDRALTYIEQLWESLLIRFELPPYQFLLKSILKGSIEISWCFPQSETVRIIEVVKSSSHVFADHSIVRVSINEQVFYEEELSSYQETPETDKSPIKTVKTFESGVLCKEHLNDVMKVLRPIAGKWKEIGLALLVKQQVLDDFENNPELIREGSEGFLRETLNAVETLTVRRLVDVLRSPSVQEEGTAYVLEERYFNERVKKVNAEIATLAQSFESLKSSVLKELNAINVTVKRLHEVVVGVYPDRAIPKKVIVEMETASSSQEFFCVITRHGMWNCINYHLLEIIIQRAVPRDNQLQNELEQHKERVVKFAERTPVLDYIDLRSSEKTQNVLPFDQYTPNAVMFALLQLKLALSAENRSLTVILSLQNYVMKQFSFLPPTLLLGAVGRGSIAVTLHFPRVEMERVCAVANSSGDFFKEHAVEAANIDNQFQYQQTILGYNEVRPSGSELQAGSNLGQFPGERAPRVRHLEDLSELEQRLFYTRILRTHFNFLYQHLNTPAILETLGKKGLITPKHHEYINMYSDRLAQNILAIYTMQLTTAPPNCMEKLCEIFLSQGHIAEKLHSEYQVLAKYGYSVPSPSSLAPWMEQSQFASLSSAFLKMLSDVTDAFDQHPDFLDVLKKLLKQLVLPSNKGQVVALIDPDVYTDTDLVRQLFRMLSPLLNCLNTDLIQYLCEEAQCSLGLDALEEFSHVREQHSESILCIRREDESEINDLDTASISAPLSPGHFKAHTMALDTLQSLHPLVFARLDYHKTTASPKTIRLSVEVNHPLLTLHGYNNITDAVSAAYLLPKIAMVYAGCSVSPLVLTWLVPAQLHGYLKVLPFDSAASGDRLLAEQGVVSVAIGEDIRTVCLGIKEVRLREATMYGLEEWLPDLIQCGVDINAIYVCGQTAVSSALAYGHIEVVKLLVQAGADLREHKVTVLMYAAEEGHTDLIQALLSRQDVDINMRNKWGHTAVYIASAYGQSEVVKVLVKAKADLELQVKSSQGTPLIISSNRGYSEVVSILLEGGANINHQDKFGETAVYNASGYGQSDVVKLLVRAGADLELQREESQTTPLSIASYGGHSEVVTVLLDGGANVNHQDRWGETAVYKASGEGHSDVVKLLVQAGADLELQIEETGGTPLTIASDRGHSMVVRVLLEAGANINHQNKGQITPLMCASGRGHTDVVQVFLSRQDLNINMTNEIGWTAADFAKICGHLQIHQMIALFRQQ